MHGVVEVRNRNLSFVFSAIYASPKLHCRKILWDELKTMASNMHLSWLALGDFNEVVNQSEKLGGNKISLSRSNLYASTMDDCNLIDIGYNGPKFTWTNKRRNNPIYERLDRGWANVEWFTMFPDSGP